MDSKLRELLKLAQTKHPDDQIVFTESKDTANYIAQGMRSLVVDKMAVATRDSEDATRLAQRFSPETNPAASDTEIVTPDSEIRVLIATDVLSEGQNLQQAHIIANYDLPWAIIKLIQRADRVDRVGQRGDEALLYTMVHGKVEEHLNLRRRIQERLAANAATFGSDEKFFGTDSETQVTADLYDGKIDDTTAADDVDASSLAFEIWESATRA